MRFYFPYKPTRISIDSELFTECDRDPNYILQVKKNGWRVQIHKEGDKVTFYTRHNNLLSSIAQDADWLMLEQLVRDNVKADSIIIDGEFIHRRGEVKNTLYVWDIFEYNGKVLRMPYRARKELLGQIVAPSANLMIAIDYSDNFKVVWDSLGGDEDEGIVLKDLREDLYVNFKKTINSPRWFKVLRNDPRNHVGE